MDNSSRNHPLGKQIGPKEMDDQKTLMDNSSSDRLLEDKRGKLSEEVVEVKNKTEYSLSKDGRLWRKKGNKLDAYVSQRLGEDTWPIKDMKAITLDRRETKRNH